MLSQNSEPTRLGSLSSLLLELDWYALLISNEIKKFPSLNFELGNCDNFVATQTIYTYEFILYLQWSDAMVLTLLFCNLVTSFCNFCSFLVTIMGLVIPWSLTLALVDMFSVFVKPPSRQLGLMTIIVIGDWVPFLLT